MKRVVRAAKTNDDLRVISVQVDVVIEDDLDGVNVARDINDTLRQWYNTDVSGMRIIGTEFVDDITEVYKKDYPEEVHL